MYTVYFISKLSVCDVLCTLVVLCINVYVYTVYVMLCMRVYRVEDKLVDTLFLHCCILRSVIVSVYCFVQCIL